MRNFFLNTNTKYVFIFILMAVFMFTACSEKNGKGGGDTHLPPSLSNDPDETILFPAQDYEFDDDWVVVLPIVNFSATNTQTDVEAVPLSYFVLLNESPIFSEDYAKMFTYRIVSSDGWDPWSMRQAIDLYWDTLMNGFLTLIDPYRTYFHELSQNSVYAYNVQSANKLQVYRTIMVVKPDGTEVMFQVNILDHVEQNNPQNTADILELSFKMTDLITKYITESPQDYEFLIAAADGFTTILGWEHIQGAWYSRMLERVFYPSEDGDVPGQLRPRNVTSITLFK